jgi:PHD/YefM family antitoxin component YafN of YafNO toxin-antitoxin module
MQLRKMSAGDVKNNFGKFLDMAQSEPIVVTRKDKTMGVFLSLDAYEDKIWAERAIAASAEGYLGLEESKSFIESILNAPD